MQTGKPWARQCQAKICPQKLRKKKPNVHMMTKGKTMGWTKPFNPWASLNKRGYWPRNGMGLHRTKHLGLHKTKRTEIMHFNGSHRRTRGKRPNCKPWAYKGCTPSRTQATRNLNYPIHATSEREPEYADLKPRDAIEWSNQLGVHVASDRYSDSNFRGG